jgi:hypothetical protein
MEEIKRSRTSIIDNYDDSKRKKIGSENYISFFL